MRLATLWVVMILAGGGVCGQKPCVGGEHPNNAPDCIPAAQYFPHPLIGKLPAPLKCGKWEHVEYYGPPCGSETASCNQETGCTCPARQAFCAVTQHTVTEKDWQELMARLKALEVKPKSQQHRTACARRPDPGVFWSDGSASIYVTEPTGGEGMWFSSLPTCTEEDFRAWREALEHKEKP